jgi:dethiobiotin synthetase
MTGHRARGVFLAGTDTGVGKTRIAVGLIRALTAHGWRACGMKPVASGTIATEYGVINEDVDAIATASGRNSATAADINLYCFEWPVSPHIGAERIGIVIDMGRIVASYERLARDQDIVVVEGAGGWLAPIGPVATMADVAAALQLPVVLVVGLRLGCLNHALLSAQAIARAGAQLAGWIGSAIDPAMPAQIENVEALRQRLPAPQLGLLPFSRAPEHDAAALELAAHALMGPPARAALATGASCRPVCLP